MLTQVVPQQLSPAGQPVCWQSMTSHTPEMQDAPLAQTWPQKPQLLGSSVVSTSHPSAIWPSQSAKPVLHEVMRQPLSTQPVVALGTIWGQTLPQVPQLSGSLVVTAQVAPQQASPPGQGEPVPQPPTQTPPEHASPVGQTWPQLPQLLGSPSVLTSQPSLTTPLQSAKPTEHPARSHAEPSQPAIALA